MKAGLLIGQLNDSGNESALVRSAEALGINQVHIVDGSESDIRGQVARGAEKHVSMHHYDTYKEFVAKAHDNNHSVVAIENAPESTPIEDGIEYPVNPIFVTGNEAQGCPKAVVDGADELVHISQSVNSYVRCLNTTVAGSIVMHDWFANRRNRSKEQEEFALKAD